MTSTAHFLLLFSSATPASFRPNTTARVSPDFEANIVSLKVVGVLGGGDRVADLHYESPFPGFALGVNPVSGFCDAFFNCRRRRFFDFDLTRHAATGALKGSVEIVATAPSAVR